jgi:hypothetical protein
MSKKKVIATQNMGTLARMPEIEHFEQSRNDYGSVESYD